MIFRQLFDPVSSTYTYLIGSRRGGEALIIDPVLDRVDRYIQLIRELELELVKAIDTHVHADHLSGLGALRDPVVAGDQSVQPLPTRGPRPRQCQSAGLAEVDHRAPRRLLAK